MWTIPKKAGKPESQSTRFVRCLAIYRRLSQAEVCVSTLAQEYGVSVRSIQRDLNALTLAGYPIMPAEGKGRYRIIR